MIFKATTRLLDKGVELLKILHSKNTIMPGSLQSSKCLEAFCFIVVMSMQWRLPCILKGQYLSLHRQMLSTKFGFNHLLSEMIKGIKLIESSLYKLFSQKSKVSQCAAFPPQLRGSSCPSAFLKNYNHGISGTSVPESHLGKGNGCLCMNSDQDKYSYLT